MLPYVETTILGGEQTGDYPGVGAFAGRVRGAFTSRTVEPLAAPTEVTVLIHESLSTHAELLRDEETPFALDELCAPTGRRLRRWRHRHANPDATNEALPRTAEPASLAGILQSTDPLIIAFIVFRTGNIKLADSQDELMAGGRAIMHDGAYNSSIMVEALRAQGFKIGRAVAPFMLADSIAISWTIRPC